MSDASPNTEDPMEIIKTLPGDADHETTTTNNNNDGGGGGGKNEYDDDDRTWVAPTYPLILEVRNAHERDQRIQFEEKEHKYTIDGSSTMYQSCTGFIHQFCQEFDADAVIMKMMSGPKWNPTNKYWGMTRDQIKAQWAQGGSDASAEGTKVHLLVEYINNDVVLRKRDAARKEIQMFRSYCTMYAGSFQPYRTEWSIFIEEYLVCGQVDVILFNPATGKYIVGDYKRCKAITRTNKYQKMKEPLAHLDDCNYNHYCIQLNVYRAILERKYGIVVESMHLCVLHPAQTQYMFIPIPFMEREVQAMFQHRLVTHILDEE